jgi:hypothetical protein
VTLQPLPRSSDRTRPGTAAVTFAANRSGLLITRYAWRSMGSPEHVDLAWDPDTRQVHIIPAPARGPSTYPVVGQPSGTPTVCSAALHRLVGHTRGVWRCTAEWVNGALVVTLPTCDTNKGMPQ